MQDTPSQINEADLKQTICQLKDQREYAELVEYLIGAIASGQLPSNLQAKAYNELGVAHLQMDAPLEAEKAFLSAIERNPEAVNPRFNRANLALYAQKYEPAFAQYQQVLEIDPEHVGARYHAGLCCAMMDKPEEALPYFEAAAQAQPEAMGPNFWAGETLIALEQFDCALPYFLQASTITPDHRESRRGIAICQFEHGNYEACVEQCDMLITSGGGAEYLAFQIKGDAFIELGEIEAAALCHLELADMDFDARDFLIMRTKELVKQHPDAVARYVEVILDTIPELERALVGLVPVDEQEAVLSSTY